MKSVPKLIRRFMGVWLLASFGLLVINFMLLIIIAGDQEPNSSPWQMAEEILNALQHTEAGVLLPENRALELREAGAWGIFIDNDSRQVIWHTEGLPQSIPMQYTLSETVWAARGYIDDYPTFTAGNEKGVVILGYPEDSYWKHMWPSWDMDLIKNSLKIFGAVLGINLAVIFLIYVVSNAKILRSVKPIVSGIEELPTGKAVHVREKGLLSEIAAKINHTSEVLQMQKYQLKKKDTARANWIAGVSHDIRTPLSMVMGYAGQLEQDLELSEKERKKASMILKQSRRLRDLINDLNLASKLEYNMQPLQQKQVNLVALVRQTAVDFVNLDMEGKYPIEWTGGAGGIFVNADGDLVKRGVSNLIQNCINHNEDGCTIFVSVEKENDMCVISVEDNGCGASPEEIDRLNHAPHYMVCDRETREQRHGLGLLIVKQIAEAHHGKVVIGKSGHGGFGVEIFLPAS